MKKILVTLAAVLLFTGTANAQTETRAQATNSLMAFGMSAQLATKVAGLATGLGIVGSTLTPSGAGTIDIGTVALPFKIIYAGDATRVVYMGDDNSVGFMGTQSNVNLALLTNALTRWTVSTSGAFANDATSGGDVSFAKGGTTIAVQEAVAGTACSGTLTANGATPVVTSTSCATTGSRIFLNRTSAETGTVSAWRSALSNGVSFSVTSEAADTGSYDWLIVHEAP